MASVTISLPDSMLDFVNAQAAGKGADGVGEYLRGLVREAQIKARDARLAALLRDGLAANPLPLDAAFRAVLETKVGQVLDRHAAGP
jgi:antitoxin ParD1/3/4